jgi:hypothetical protein
MYKITKYNTVFGPVSLFLFIPSSKFGHSNLFLKTLLYFTTQTSITLPYYGHPISHASQFSTHLLPFFYPTIKQKQASKNNKNKSAAKFWAGAMFCCSGPH